MSAWRTTYHIVRADLLDRLRGYRFLLTLGVTVCAAYVFVPPADAGYVTLAFGAYRGVYNSAFSGAMLSLLTVSILSLLGFYVVRGSIERDRRTGIGNMVAVSPVRTTHYLIAKTVSHFVVLVVMVTVVLAAAIPMQVWRGESGQLDLVALSAPFVWIVLPAMAVVAALSVLFDLVAPLRGSFGNVLYFFLWGGMTTAARFGVSGPAVLRPVGEFFGFTLLWPPIAEACQQAFGDCSIDQLSMGIIPVPEGALVETFLWEGMSWSAPIVVSRVLWMVAAVLVPVAIAPAFHRFDPARFRAYEPVSESKVRKGSSPRWNAVAARNRESTMSTLWKRATRHPALYLLTAELNIMLKGQPVWWYVGSLGVIVAGALLPLDSARLAVLPIAFIWPFGVWAQSGIRETLYETRPVVFTAPGAARKVLLAQWAAGIVLAGVLSGPVIVRAALTGDLAAFVAHAVAALFVPTLALAFGVLSGGRVLFEVAYGLLWFVSLQADIPPLLDFMARGELRTASAWVTPLYAGVTALLLALALWGRRRQMTG